MKLRTVSLALVVTLTLAACATLGQVIQPPRFGTPSTNNAELRLVAPTLAHPVGGLALRLWTRVENPNPFGITLATLAGALQLGGMHAADVSFPLGLPLVAAQDTLVPLDISIDLRDVPGLADVARRALTGQPLDYALTGRVGVDAGVLGQPVFGPMLLAQGSVRPLR